MAKVKNSLPLILTPEEKAFLRSYSRYLKSMGMQDGSLEIDTEGGFDPSDINWQEIDGFSNNYRVEITSELIEIFKKISNFIYENDLYTHIDVDYTNYERIEFEIDTIKQEISVHRDYSYNDVSDTESIEFGKDDEDVIRVFNALEQTEIIVPDNGIIELSYNGSGDSGYIESSFESIGDAVPAEVEDLAYEQLENNFGGWEINEGSQGHFVFDFNDGTITLNHSNNLED